MSTMIAYRDIPRIPSEMLATLAELRVADLHDALAFDAKRRGLLDVSMRPVTPDRSFFGQAVTVLAAPGDNLMMHCGLFVAQPGDVLLVSNGGVSQGALWGEHATLEAMTRGLAGIVIDGPARDTAAIRRMRAPVWASCISVTSSGKQGPGAVNVPVVCAGVTVNPGDIVVGDDDGVICFAPRHLGQIVDAVRGRMAREKVLRERIRNGERHFEVFGIDKVAMQAGVEFRDGVFDEDKSDV